MKNLIDWFIGEEVNKKQIKTEGAQSIRSMDSARDKLNRLSYAISVLDDFSDKLGVEVEYNPENMCKVTTRKIERIGKCIQFVVCGDSNKILSCSLVDDNYWENQK